MYTIRNVSENQPNLWEIVDDNNNALELFPMNKLDAETLLEHLNKEPRIGSYKKVRFPDDMDNMLNDPMDMFDLFDPNGNYVDINFSPTEDEANILLKHLNRE